MSELSPQLQALLAAARQQMTPTETQLATVKAATVSAAVATTAPLAASSETHASSITGSTNANASVSAAGNQASVTLLGGKVATLVSAVALVAGGLGYQLGKHQGRHANRPVAAAQPPADVVAPPPVVSPPVAPRPTGMALGNLPAPLPTPAPAPTLALPADEVAPQSAPPKLKTKPPVALPAAPPQGLPTLEQELAVLADAQLALRASDLEAALVIAAKYRREFGSLGQLGEDADAIVVEAKCRLGTPDHRAKLQSFQQAWPRSAQRTRLDKLCTNSNQ